MRINAIKTQLWRATLLGTEAIVACSDVVETILPWNAT